MGPLGGQRGQTHEAGCQRFRNVQRGAGWWEDGCRVRQLWVPVLNLSLSQCGTCLTFVTSIALPITGCPSTALQGCFENRMRFWGREGGWFHSLTITPVASRIVPGTWEAADTCYLLILMTTGLTVQKPWICDSQPARKTADCVSVKLSVQMSSWARSCW